MAGIMEKKEVDYEEDSELLKAIANPARLRILAGLALKERNVGAMQEKLGLPQSTISQHLSILRRRGIIKARREGVKMCYRIVDDRVTDILKSLESN
jgi:DNA-binding transcriptional ArsR family regulator